MWLFKKPKDETTGYKNDLLGCLQVERTQLPHRLITVDNVEYGVTSWIFQLRLTNGPVLMERVYSMGSKESIEALRELVRLGVIVKSEYEATMLFYQDLQYSWR